MLIFQSNNTLYAFIHIPKNSGKYIRNKITSNCDNSIIKVYWDIENNIDLAHIPYIKKHEYLENSCSYNFFANCRNPYDRMISIIIYKTYNSDPSHIKNIIKNYVVNLNFNLDYDYNIIHYYPQYMFVCDSNGEINNVKIEKIENIETPNKYDINNILDAECINIINNVYYKDFILFNYEMR